MSVDAALRVLTVYNILTESAKPYDAIQTDDPLFLKFRSLPAVSTHLGKLEDHENSGAGRTRR